jgi:hypothetical protein
MEAQYIKINENGSKYYYKDREMTIPHRTDGPAIEWSGGTKSWCINGKNLTEEEFNRRTSPEIVLTMDEIAAKLGVDVSKLKIKK